MTIHVFVDNGPDHDGPTELDIPYSELDEDELFELTMQGDQGAVEYMNADHTPEEPEEEPPAPTEKVVEPTQIHVHPEITVNPPPVTVQPPEVNVTVQPTEVKFPEEKPRRIIARKLEDGSIEIITTPVEDIG